MSKRREVFPQVAKQEFLWCDMDASTGGSRVEIPEKLICAGIKGADRDIDRAMGKDDDLEFEVVAFKLFRMVVVVGHMDGKGFPGGNGDRVGDEFMMQDRKGDDAGGVTPSREGEKEKECRRESQGEGREPIGKRPVPTGHRLDGSCRVWDMRQSQENMNARYPQTVRIVIREGRAR